MICNKFLEKVDIKNRNCSCFYSLLLMHIAISLKQNNKDTSYSPSLLTINRHHVCVYTTYTLPRLGQFAFQLFHKLA